MITKFVRNAGYLRSQQKRGKLYVKEEINLAILLVYRSIIVYYLLKSVTRQTIMFTLFEWLKKLWGIWNGLDKKTKRRIIEAFIEAYKKLIRAFYRQWESKKTKERSNDE